MSEKLDVIIFGATGFTGKYTVYEAVEVLENLKWGVAGRNKDKLQDVLKEIGAKVNKDLSNIPMIIADVGDEKSLQEMASKCKVLVNCCGPYRFYGEAVVKACLEVGTHHVDVSGEPQYMETMQLKYNDMAKEKGVYIVSACGFDSIPADLGTVFVEKNFDGVVNSVETYLETWVNGDEKGGASIHFGTWESAVFGLAHANELRTIREKLHQTKLPNFLPRLKSNGVLHKSDVTKSYCLPFLGSDRSVVLRSQRYLYETEKKRPIQMQAYIGFRSLLATIFLIFYGIFFKIVTSFALGRSFLLTYPSLCTFGFVSHQGPSEKKMQNTKLAITFVAKGWSDKLADVNDQYSTPPTKTLVAKVTGSNPGYGATCVAVLVSALTILKESDKMPGTGGVLSPGAAFYKTSAIESLQKFEHGFQFEVISKN